MHRTEGGAVVPELLPAAPRRVLDLGAGVGQLLALSVTILLIASTAPVAFEPGQLTWPGVLDVATAFAVVIAGMAVTVKAGALVDDEARRLSYSIATGLMPLALVGMWLFQDHLRWNVLLPGLAWRSYALLFSLPPAVALWRPRRQGEP